MIRESAAKLIKHPRIGRPGRVEGTRELVISRYPCIVSYQVDPDAVRVLAVVHSARRWPESFPAEQKLRSLVAPTNGIPSVTVTVSSPPPRRVVTKCLTYKG